MNKNKQVGYLGPEGTFSHEAVLKVVDETDEIKPYPTILNIFEDLEDNKIDMAIVPVENSTEGSVLITLDCLTNFNNIKIIQEFQIPIKHNLLIQHGKTIDEIKVICSHQQPLAQCREYIYKLKKPVQSMPSTANAARYVTEIETAAVIGNKMLADKYDLKIIDENIQDYKNNVTRFLVLKKDAKTKPTGHDKTSIIISLYDDKPGGFYKVLYEFKEENVNLTHIESRPSKEGMGKYLFFIDMEGHKLDENISRVLMKVEKKVKMFKILGSYETINCWGGINIPNDSRHTIERKLKNLEKQREQGFINEEDYETLRIRYERKLGNKEAVTKLQEAKGFDPDKIKEKKARKEELYDDFVDEYTKIESKDISDKSVFSKRTARKILIVVVIIAFAIGLAAGVSTLNTVEKQQQTNITVGDSAFSPDAIANATNLTANNTTIAQTTKSSTSTPASTVKSTTKKSSSSSKAYSGSSSSNSGSKKPSSGGSNSGSHSSGSSSSSGSGSSGSSSSSGGSSK